MFQTIIGAVSSFMYSKLLVIILIGAGLYFTIRTRFPQVRLFERACESVMEKPDDKEAISSFQALMVSTASRVGTGNIVGVSSAICIGGFSKLRDSRTTAIEFDDMKEQFNQGIFIDIFPLDSTDDGSAKMKTVTNIKKQRKRLSVPMMKNGYKRQQSLSFHIRKQLMILTSMRMFLTRLGSSGVQQQIQKTTKHLLTLRQDLVQQSAR